MKTNSAIKDRLKSLFFATKRALKENEPAKERKQKDKKVQEEIVRQKEQLQKILDHLPVLIMYHDSNNQTNLINKEVERILGWTLEEWRTENILEKCYPDPQILKEAYDHFNNRSGVWRDFETRTKSGTVIDISWTNVKLSDDLSMRIGQDITRHKQKEELLKKSQALLASSLDSQNETIIFSLDKNYNYLMFNKAHSDVMKYAWDADVRPGMNIIDCIPVQEERMMAKNNYDRALNGESFTITQKYGNVNPEYYESFFNPIFDEKNKIIGCTGLARNISQRLLREEELRNSYLFSETILKTIPFGIDIVDETGTILFQNEKFKKQFGEEAIGAKCWDLYREDKKQCPGCPLKNGIVPKTTGTYESHGVIGGRIFDISYTGMIYKGKKAILQIFQDITDRKNGEAVRKHYEEELIAAKEKAEESDRLKSAFLSNMSHEIRTPMNGIIGFSELLKEPNLTFEEQKDFIQTIQISGARMLNTINNIIDISKIESGLTTLDIKETDINDKIDFAYKFFMQETKAKGLQFSVKKGLSNKEALVKTDNEKVYGIITNLIKNAIKFTNEGSIELGYEKKGDFLEFHVADTGVGIPEKNLKIIFERFRQGNELHNRFFEGSGLGLSISRSYLEMLGGKIWVESKEGAGSTFYFTIPYNASTEERDAETDKVFKEQLSPGIKKLKTLIVEDDEISYSLLVKYVQSFSVEVLHAINGIQAIEACRNNPDLDLVLMDIRMPVMSGLQATQQIRQFNKDVIIIAQTSFGFSSDRDQALEAGCNDYITKPIVKNLLYGIIKKYRDI